MDEQIKYDDDLYYKPVDLNKIARIPSGLLEYIEDEIILEAMPNTTYKELVS